MASRCVCLRVLRVDDFEDVANQALLVIVYVKMFCKEARSEFVRTAVFVSFVLHTSSTDIRCTLKAIFSSYQLRNFLLF